MKRLTDDEFDEKSLADEHSETCLQESDFWTIRRLPLPETKRWKNSHNKPASHTWWDN